MTSPLVTVVVCTYNRIELLRRTLDSCLRDATLRDLPFEIVVSDNSPDGHARELVTSLGSAPRPVRWVASSPPNIAVARNAGLRAAVAPLVAFLDDDLEVVPGWLDHLYDTVVEKRADAAMGPVLPRFMTGPPRWDPSGTRYTRTLDAPDGTPIVIGGPARTRALTPSTASSIWRADTCFVDPSPFDPAFGASGGEDLDLMWRLHRRGRWFAWSPGATVYESVPASRTRLRYQMLRSYVGGQTYAALAIRHEGLRAVTSVTGRGAVQLVASAVMVPVLAVAAVLSGGRAWPRLVRAALTTAAAAGKLTWFRLAPLYHLEQPPEGGASASTLAP